MIGDIPQQGRREQAFFSLPRGAQRWSPPWDARPSPPPLRARGREKLTLPQPLQELPPGRSRLGLETFFRKKPISACAGTVAMQVRIKAMCGKVRTGGADAGMSTLADGPSTRSQAQASHLFKAASQLSSLVEAVFTVIF